jgi:hypothetical protein
MLVKSEAPREAMLSHQKDDMYSITPQQKPLLTPELDL